MQKVPYLLVVGDKELKNNSISVRARGGVDLGSMSLNKFLDILKKDIEKKN